MPKSLLLYRLDKLRLGIGVRVDVALKSGNTSTAVTLRADANRLQTESGAVEQPEAAW